MPAIARLRLARATDLPALLDEMTAFNHHERIPWTRARGGPVLRRLISTPALGRVVVAAARGHVDGYAIVTWGFDLEWNGRDAMLSELWVAPRARGTGLGARLLADAERRARAGGAAALHLMVRHRNAPARALYERVGFTSPGRLLLTKPLRRRRGPA